MKRASVWNVTGVLCALLLGACAGATPDASKVAGATADNAQPASPALDSNADVTAIARDLPGTLDGEIRRAQLLRSKGDLEDASRALAQLMLIAPDDARVVGEYGKVLAQQGHPREAVSFLQRAVELQPKNWTFYSALGVAYDQSDDHSHARLAYEHALTLSPGQPAVLNNMAVSRMLADDWSGAQRLLAEASNHGGGNPKIANNRDMLAGLKAPAAQANAKSASLASNPPPKTESPRPGAKSTTREAVAPPKPLGASVVMQAVPVDPQAGPVRSKTTLKTAGLPKRDKHGTVSAPPALRTAAEVN